MKVENNLLLFNAKTEFNNKILNYFFNRMKLFLLVDSDIPKPKIVFTSSKNIINKYYQGKEGSDCLGFYDEATNTVVFNADRYNTKSDNYRYGWENASFIDKPLREQYNYIVPLSDIYHELTHHCQFHLGSYKYTPLLEGTAEIFTFILTAQNTLDYVLEATAVWYIGRKLLKYSITNFYNFVISIINNEDHTLQQRFSNNKIILKLVANKYNGDWTSFFKNLHKEFGNADNLENMKKDLYELHNLIFYKY